MSYEDDIKHRVRTTELWPDFETPGFLDTLDELAEESLAKNTIEGALASKFDDARDDFYVSSKTS
jgi:hypothetical protein